MTTLKYKLKQVLLPPLVVVDSALSTEQSSRARLVVVLLTKAAWAVVDEVETSTYLIAETHRTMDALRGQKTSSGVSRSTGMEILWMAQGGISLVGRIA